MEGTLLTGETLADNFGVFVDQYAHDDPNTLTSGVGKFT
jgi:hypothetical protein